MSSLGRSSTVRELCKQDGRSPKRGHSFRYAPSHSKSHSIIRRQTSEHFPSQLTLTRDDHSNRSGLFLTVDDVQNGASSIDSGSEDEDSGFIASTSTFHPQPSLSSRTSVKEERDSRYSNTNYEDEEEEEEEEEEDHPRSLASTLKTKLHLSRKSARPANSRPKKSTSAFSLRGHKKDKKEPKLYDDGVSPIYPPPPRESAERDQYGFIKCTQWLSQEDYDAFEKSYRPVMDRRLQKWRQMLSDNHGQWPQKSSKFKRYIRKGIPPELRGQAWFHYSGAKEKMAQNPGVYASLVEQAEAAGSENEHLEIIERDLHRTFPDNIKFKASNSADPTDVPIIQALRRLLSGFSVYSPSIGYCQSLNYIAGLLLLFMQEEEAFWTFVAVVQDILPPNIYDVTMEGANIDQTVLMMLLSERCPQIWHRVGDGKSFWECEEAEVGMPTTSLVTSHWFLTMFINILPIESVLRVWDCFFYEGQRALFRVALGIFKVNEQAILNVHDSLEVFQVVQNIPKRMVDCHKLIDASHHTLLP
ncbi:rab-GTPase-TBC domain-containing protein [Phycomyces nitens]|nr:rab-GTPase-TBC domain-containing protein [Phycomyces nitens]